MIFFDVDTALSEVPVNSVPLTDDTDFKTVEESVAYNAAGLELIWHFVTSAGAYTATVVTPTTGGDYDWAHQDGGMYTIEIPASGGASINNDTEGYGWFTGKATGVLPWRGPTLGFRASGLNDLLTDSTYSTTRGLAGTALPDAAADAAGGLVVSDAGGLDIDNRSLSAAAVTNANVVFDTDFATNYNTTRDAWVTNQQDTVGTGNITADMRAIDGNAASAGKLRQYWVAVTASDDVASVSGADITLTTGLAADDQPNGDLMIAWSGTGSPQARTIIDYDHGSKVATVDSEFNPQLDATTDVIIIPGGRVDIEAIDGSQAALANLKAAFDGTGYDIGGIDVSELNTAVDAIGSDGSGLTEAGGDGDHLDSIPDMATATNQTTIANYIDTEITAIITHLTDIKGGTFDGATDSLEAIRNQGDSAWITATGFSTHSAADVWASGTRTLTAFGFTVDINSNADITAILADTNELQTNQGNWLTATGFSTHSAADVWTSGTRTLSAFGFTVDINSNADITAILADTNELQGEWTDGGRLDLIADAILADTNELQTNQGNWLTATGFSTHSAADVWTSGTRTLSAFGFTVDINSNADITAILADTNELQGDWTNGGRLDLIVDAILADTASLNETALSEITGAADIPAEPTLRQAVMLVYMWLRNNSQSTSSERRVVNDAGTEVLDATVSDDGTTFEQGKLGDA